MSESRPESDFSTRVRELRRRHFGPRGKAAFAARLAISEDQLDRIERGEVPPGDLIVRICEATGEDLQWLLTGVASRSTMVISGSRGRHQELLAKIAQTLETNPALVRPIEAFVDLLTTDAPLRPRPLPPGPRRLIPIFLPESLPEQFDFDPQAGVAAAPALNALVTASAASYAGGRAVDATLVEPADEDAGASAKSVQIVLAAGENRVGVGRYIECDELAECLPGVLGVEVCDDAMKPMFATGDAIIVALACNAKLGGPALCRIAGEAKPRCRVWLGDDGREVRLGRVSDGQLELVEHSRLLWSYEVIYRVRTAA